MHEELSAGETWDYEVRARNAAGEGIARSITVTTKSQSLSPPHSLSATADGETAIDLSWTAPSDTGKSAIRGYKIEVSSNGSTWTTRVGNTRDTTDLTYKHTNLSAGDTRHYRVSAINNHGTSNPSNVARTTTESLAPTPPRNLRARASGDSAIDLSWTAPADTGGSKVTGYKIEVSSNGGSSFTTRVSNTRNANLSYRHRNLAANTTRHYRVSAINSNGTSGPSNVASATTGSSAPSPPRNLRATASGDSAIDLAWTVPSDAGGSRITGYKIEVSSNGGSSFTTLNGNTGNTDLTYRHSNLAASTTRHYRVSAINSNGTSRPSNVANATTGDGAGAGTPSPPRNLRATASGDSAIDLAWTAPADAGGSNITGYKIEVSSNGGSSFTTLNGNTGNTDLTYRHRNLAANTTRHYQVSAINSNGTSEPSNVASATTEDGAGAGTPTPPRNLRATASGDSAIDLAWTAPADTGGSKVTGYKIEVSSNGGSSFTTRVGNTRNANLSYRHSNLAANTTRHYRVSAINSNGTSGPSNVANATTGAGVGAPSPPRNLSAKAIGDSAIDLSWTAPADTGSSRITGYKIEVSSNGGSSFTTLNGNTGNTNLTYKHTGLSAGTTRHYRVSAINSIGPSGPSNTARATTEGGSESGPPRNLRATASGDSAIDLSWTAPADTGGSKITGYKIEVSSNGGSSFTTRVGNTRNTNLTYKHTGLSAGTTRHYRVSAINGQGTSGPSNVANATTGGGSAPAPPTDLTATADGETAIDLSWTAPADTGSSAITGYGIEVSENDSIWTDLEADTESRGTTYEHSGLDPGDTRYYRVSAINRVGTSGPSNVDDATTESAPPGAPTGLAATALDSTQIELAWTEPVDDGGSDITGYRIAMSPNGISGWSDLVANTGSTATSYADTTLSANTTRFYRVSAINGAGTGPTSNVDGATTIGTPPGAPTGLVATPQDTSQIDLAWRTPSNDGGSPITGYRIEGSDNGSSWVDLARDTKDADTNYFHTRLAPGTLQYYRVSAINSVGTGSPSRLVIATTFDFPAPPTDLTATQNGQTMIDLSWNRPSNDGGSPITGYRIDVSENGGATWSVLVANFQSTTTAYSHTGLSAGDTRHYRVFAMNKWGSGGQSDVEDATTDATEPGPPGNLTAEANGQTQIVLDWDPPDEDGGSTVTGYRIQFSRNGGATWSLLLGNTSSTRTRYTDLGLKPGTTRHYQVAAINSVGTGDYSNVDSATTAPTVPDAPTGLGAAASGTSRIDLSWTAPVDGGGADITGYRIEVAAQGTGPWQVLRSDTQSDATEYSHTGLAPGTTRHYRVSAINAAGTGDPSDVASAITDPTVPDPPTNLNAAADGQTRIRLSWTPPAYDGGAPVSAYRIEVSADGAAPWTVLSSNTGNARTTFTHTGLEPGTTRHYRVSAVTVAGNGLPSNVADATTEATVPDAPTGLGATANGISQIDLAWTAPTNHGGAPVTGYRIEFSTTKGATWSTLEASTGNTSTAYSHTTGLPPATRRDYRISAINRVGAGATSNVADATTDPDLPDPPTDLTADASGPSAIDLSWTTPDYTGGVEITGYRIEVSEDGGSTWSVHVRDTDSDDPEYTHTGLDPASTRYYRVSAINVAGVGEASNVSGATTDPIVPDPPTDLTADASGARAIDLSWNTPDYTGGAEITGYRIEVSEDGGSRWSVHVRDTDSDDTEYTHTGLDPASTRYYRVSAINVAGVGEASNVSGATTDPIVPDPPTDLTADASGPSAIDLSWKTPDYTGGAEITGYRIEVSEDGGSTWSVHVDDTDSDDTEYTHTGLDPASTRYYRVSAINVAGVGEASNVSGATTDPIVPEAPTDLTADASGPRAIDLSWKTPDYTGGAEITGYRIEVSEDGGSTWSVHVDDTDSDDTEYTHTGLDPASTWYYRVSAINVAGVGEASNVSSATTDPIVPEAPTGLTVEANGTSRIDLAWTAPDYDGGAEITGYQVEVSEDGGSTWSVHVGDTDSDDTEYTHTGLDPASTRYYRVSAINVAGVGEASNVSGATTDATVPNVPTSLTATADGTAGIDLDWTAPGFDGGSPITGYRIEVSENAGTDWTDLVANTGSSDAEYSHTGLDPASTRHYRVSAINEIGTSQSSNVANATTDATVPDPPTNLVANASSPTQIDLTWAAPAYDGGAPVTSYRIEVSEDTATWANLVSSTDSVATTYSHTGLQPGSTRHYRVSAINVAGAGEPSGIATASTDDPVQRAGRVNEAILPHFAAAATSSTLGAISARIEAVAARNPLPSQLRASGLASLVGNLRGGGGVNTARLLNGASFAMPLGGDAQQQQAGEGFGAATWGSAEYIGQGQPDGEDVEWEGGMLSLHLGADMRVHRDFLAGMSASRSAGDYDFTDVIGARKVEGTYEARMNSVNPYFAWLPGRMGVAVWAVGSFGWGEVAVDDEFAGRRESGARSTTGAVGASRIMVTNGASSLRLRTEGWLSRVEVDGGEGMDSLTLEMHRARFALEWSQVHKFRSGDEVTVQLEGGARFGDGEGTDGAGMEFGGGLRYASPTSGLTMEGHGRLLATGDSGYEEWGVRGMIQIDPQAATGISLRLVPAWGEAASGVQELWDRGAGDRRDLASGMRKGRLNAKVEYGLAEFHGTPYGRVYLVDGGTRAFGTGMRYEVSRMLDLRIEGTRTQSVDVPARHGLALRGHWKF